MNKYEDYIRQRRNNAYHGEFFFAQFALPSGKLTQRPVFIISNDNDYEDVIICLCTKHLPREGTEFDYPIEIRGKKGSCALLKKAKLKSRFPVKESTFEVGIV
ncbi:hypothetical protein WMZ97_11585 [Lentibacillus sp. N15]|uniref:hypothetical protein n=1 Tax=Lentibacillus songyuanensis TaxID=3136161 RepID=UPI0031BA2789